MPLWLIGLFGAAFVVFLLKMNADDKATKENVLKTRAENDVLELSERDVLADKRDFEDLVGRKVCTQTANAVGPAERLAPHLKSVLLECGELTVGYEKIGMDCIAKSDRESEFVVIGGNPGVSEYAVKSGEETIYSRDYEVNSDKYEPMFATVYHWYIETHRMQEEVDKESL